MIRPHPRLAPLQNVPSTAPRPRHHSPRSPLVAIPRATQPVHLSESSKDRLFVQTALVRHDTLRSRYLDYSNQQSNCLHRAARTLTIVPRTRCGEAAMQLPWPATRAAALQTPHLPALELSHTSSTPALHLTRSASTATLAPSTPTVTTTACLQAGEEVGRCRHILARPDTGRGWEEELRTYRRSLCRHTCAALSMLRSCRKHIRRSLQHSENFAHNTRPMRDLYQRVPAVPTFARPLRTTL